MWPYFGEKPLHIALPFPLPSHRKLNCSCQHGLLAQVRVVSLGFSIGFKTGRRFRSHMRNKKWPTFYSFLYKKGTARSLVPYRFVHASTFFDGISTVTTIITTNNLKLHPSKPFIRKKSQETHGTFSTLTKLSERKRLSVFLCILENSKYLTA